MHFLELLGKVIFHECYQFQCTSSPAFRTLSQIQNGELCHIFLNLNTTNRIVYLNLNLPFFFKELKVFLIFVILLQFIQFMGPKYQKLPQFFNHYLLSCKMI